eukprot:comp7695_c0_seq1/m.3329 comp7695_c0_seq1/g.3329  ORF comp7695_c0_seq1/g.3329 comp7695_c0_seq1/m.3329 type:complete len:420 (-) comp7695_c0_seq1:525-1784(-)
MPSSITHTNADIKAQHFSFHAEGVARLNHGSFGSAPTCLQEEQQQHQKRWLTQPDQMYCESLFNEIAESRKAISEMINCRADDVIYVENATVGGVIVAQRVMWGFMEGEFQKGDVVLLMNCSYGSVKKMFRGYCERAGARLVYLNVPFPLEREEQVIEELQRILDEEKGRICLAVLDHISSMPSMVFPIKQMVSMCHDAGVKEVFVDAAHAIGSVHVDVTDIGAEYYVSNLHKWLFCPAGVSFFHSKPEVQGKLHHPIIGHYYQMGIVSEAAWVGTRDYSPYLTVPKAIEFYKTVLGGRNVAEYLKEGAMEKAKMLAQAWGTALAVPEHMCASLVMVCLPESIKLQNQMEAMRWRTWIRKDYNIEAAIFSNGDGTDRGYVRLSYQIYNTDSDYERFRDCILEIKEKQLPEEYKRLDRFI